MLNIVLFGPPGAGKGTQAEKLIEKYNLVHLSTGDILRAELKAETELGKEAKKFMEKGELVPDSVVIGMIVAKIDANPNAKGFIFDGFPRTTAQAEALDEVLNKKGTPISIMLALFVDDDELIKRLLLRGKDSGRADDQDQSIIENRIKVYNKDTAPVIDFYDDKNKYKAIDGVGSIDEIFFRLCEAIDSV
ncbi:MAG: adenylate kinase [Bacteroidales bacterium]|nr:adenylate kinase [Bacteroidales bacterium]MBN2818167.1 adenylate kinase [Bacteroidales bacterium]